MKRRTKIALAAFAIFFITTGGITFLAGRIVSPILKDNKPVDLLCPPELISFLNNGGVTDSVTGTTSYAYTFISHVCGKTFNGLTAECGIVDERFAPIRINCRYGVRIGENNRYLYCETYEIWLTRTTITTDGRIMGKETLVAYQLVLDELYHVASLTCERR